MTPSSGNYAAGSSITVSVKVNTAGAAVNTAEVHINYSKDTLDLISVGSGSTFYLTSPGSPSKGDGTAYFSGGLPSPGYNGSGGVLGILRFRAKKTGTATVGITSGRVLLNDGQGTDAYTGGSGARFGISEAAAPPPAALGSVVVSSSTHKDSSAWYQSTHIELNWNTPAQATGFSYWLDQKEGTIPDDSSEGAATTKSFDVQDGIWYFHIKPIGPTAGNGTHFKIQVDSRPPQDFNVKLIGEDPANVGTTPTISFETADDLSGIYGYDVYLDDKLVRSKANSPYSFDAIDGGNHTVKVVAYDKAGNLSNSELVINVIGGHVPFWQKKFELPFFIFMFLFLMLLLQFIYIIWLLALHRKLEKSSSNDIGKDWKVPRG
ncbi:MAG: hypothetical protein KW802_01920 [Candidatus Doudnabacteria bacterium]|nr:hypothetical protein [Candidatus Doudnabacteria bacterium]